jgi:phosphatidylserine/phosphatidylglycerophosphate/cardiolipin synthase-like enzyme
MTSGFQAGKFHRNKRPNTKRYFKFGDGTELRVHFAPTDDGEHRSLVPLLLSAKAGDVIRISMFGSSGVELVRALQFAASRGARIQIILDKQQAGGLASWARAASGNLAEPNPYGSGQGSLEFKLSTWEGKNHHKVATITRANGVAEILVAGSQNWSVGGNDKNDENMLTIRNVKQGLAAARDFNTHFDTRLWPNGVVRQLSRAPASAE